MTEMAPPTDARSVLADLRPQPFGGGNPARIADPVIEPMWEGVRVLAAIDTEALLVDHEGAPIPGQPDVVAALVDALLAEAVVVDGFLTKMATRDPSGVFVAMDDLPSAGQMMGRPLLGIRPTRAENVAKELEASRDARTFGPDDTVSFVAMDLLWLDGESLLDVPLQERRRILESVLGESDLVRRGVFVRPPAEAWIASWRAMGFMRLIYRSANSRYHPGTASPDWISLPMPRR